MPPRKREVDKDEDDSEETLGQISVRYQRPIVSLLLEIQGYQTLQQDVLGFLEHLECFYIKPQAPTRLLRATISAFEDRPYIALSYTWNNSRYEDATSGRYWIETRNRKGGFPSPVRNCVFTRITRYMRSEGVKLLWIDRHSIPQRASNPDSGRKKEAGLQCMDWVYRQSKHPVALLGRPLESSRELTLLYWVMKGSFIKSSRRTGRFEITKGNISEEAADALELLFSITADLWWERAWTFQENYKGGSDMVLLIRHPDSCKRLKQQYGIFGNVPGELRVNSQQFSVQATKFCLAFRGTGSPMDEDKRRMNVILSRAGRYAVLLKESQIMSPTIIADVEKRGVTCAWDRLAIVGNCCDYSVHMNLERLRQSRHSLSLSMLAMCLLNGEVLDNRPSSERNASDLTVSGFLRAHSFDKISPPLEGRSLTFNKGSRFTDVELHESGILTSGHLWKLGRIIETDHFRDRLPWVDSPDGELTLLQQRYLTRLCQELKRFPESVELSRCIADYLEDDATDNAPFQLGEDYMLKMMKEVSEAIGNGRYLRLGSLRESEECMAIFIWEGDNKSGTIFTSLWPKDSNIESYITHDIDRHVSLEVDLRGGSGQTRNSPPSLYVRRWISGICFFVGRRREEVVFPWPPALKNMSY
ncbi:hypothetical protein F5Y07DRAFT_383841 [Xylaria sp. FL0933]|nr:hypothetical protein F5Y07DRAFT_383841 [Xylaria sp. FL0933]